AETRAREDTARMELEEIARASAEEARDVAEDANRAKSDFLAAMSHELRTPLNAIGGYGDLPLLGVRGELTDVQKQDLERVRAGQRHLLGVITDLLNFSRIEAGKIEYAVASVAIDATFNAVAPLVRPQAEAKRIDLRIDSCDPTIA